MSKIFEALQKSGNGIPESEIPLLAGEPKVAPGEGARPAGVIGEIRHAPTLSLPSVPVSPDTDKARPMTGPRTMALHLVATYPVLPFDSKSRRSVEQYRMIRTKLHHHPANPRIIVVTSAGPGDGKTVNSINIAGAMSMKAGARVLLVEGDLRRPSVARMLGLPSQPGLTDVISQVCDLEDALIRIEEFPNCFVLPAGKPSQNPPELLDSPNWHKLCDTFRERFQYVILDSPPVGSVADYDLLEAAADGLVMVVRPDHTKRATFKKAMGAIPTSKLLGVILNDVGDWFLWTAQAGNPYAYYDSLEMPPVQRSTNSGREKKAGER